MTSLPAEIAIIVLSIDDSIIDAIALPGPPPTDPQVVMYHLCQWAEAKGYPFAQAELMPDTQTFQLDFTTTDGTSATAFAEVRVATRH